jgi:hypothetical protein
MDIATRCGQDSDCNPATAAGILGVVLGYDKIPAFWKPAIERIEEMKFPYTDLTLNQVYGLGYKHALQLITSNGGDVEEENIRIKVQKPVTVKFEQSFEGLYPTKELLVRKDIQNEGIGIDFTGTGIVVTGNVKSQCGIPTSDFVAMLDVYIDGVKTEQVRMPFDFTIRKYDIFYKYLLKNQAHKLEIKWVNPDPDYRIHFKSYVVYSDAPIKKLNPGKDL